MKSSMLFLFLSFPSCITHSQADKCMNCAFYDKSVKYGTQLGYAFKKIFGYRAIADFLMLAMAVFFPIMAGVSYGF